MQSLLQRRALNVASVNKTKSTGRPVSVRQCKHVAPVRCGRTPRREALECRAFFNFFTPKPAAPASIVDPRARPLVEQLISLTSNTDAGMKTSPELKEEIASAVTELSRYCIKNPLKSDLLFGEWKVLFSSKPSAVGGPLRSGAGMTVFPGQSAKQVLEAPNRLINVVEYKTLGFLPGCNRQFGEIEPVSGDTFILSISRGEILPGVGGPIKKDFDIKRKIKILYLDEDIRVALFLPSDLRDDEADQNDRSREDVVFVFQRINETAEEEEEGSGSDGEGAEEAPKPVPFFGGGRKLESAATVAERQVRQQLKERGGGGSSAKVVAAAPVKGVLGGSARLALPAPAARPASVRGRKQREEVEEDPRERRRREMEEERARKAAEAETRAAEAKATRERAEAERQAERERQASIKDLLALLAADIKERQAEAREAAKALKEIEKTAGAGLKEVTAARSSVEEAEGDVKAVAEQLDAVGAVRKEAEKAAREAKELVVAGEKELRARIAAAAPVLTRK